MEIKNKRTKYPEDNLLDKDYFKNIDTLEKAYFLGLLASDGTVYSDSLRLILVENDRKIIDLFKIKVQSNRNIKIIDYNTKNKNHNNQACFILTDRVFVNNLKNLGIISNKSREIYNKFYIPNNKELFFSFLRGYFDGDGCLHLNIRSEKAIKGMFSICGTRLFIEELKSILLKYYPTINISINARYKDKPDTGVSLQISNNYGIISILQNMYKNCNNLFIDRKFEKFKILEEHVLKNKKLISRLDKYEYRRTETSS